MSTVRFVVLLNICLQLQPSHLTCSLTEFHSQSKRWELILGPWLDYGWTMAKHPSMLSEAWISCMAGSAQTPCHHILKGQKQCD